MLSLRFRTVGRHRLVLGVYRGARLLRRLGAFAVASGVIILRLDFDRFAYYQSRGLPLQFSATPRLRRDLLRLLRSIV